MNTIRLIPLLFVCQIFISCLGTTQTSEPVTSDIPIPQRKDSAVKTPLPDRPKTAYKDAKDSLRVGMEKFNSGYHRLMRESTGIEFARQDYDEALSILYPLRNRAIFKDKEQNALGLLLESDKKVDEAVKYYQLSADANNRDGIYNLATCYEYGTGVGKDLKKAGSLYLRSAKSGKGLAMTVVAINLAKFNNGMFAPDVSEAVKWYEKSLSYKDDLPYDRLEFVYKTLTDYYRDGVGVKRSIPMAEKYGKLFEERKKFNDKFYSDRFFDH
jgi:tetratricopeptide (TPR) repeat protein